MPSLDVVYTSVIGDYETELPQTPPGSADLICFTDNPGLRSARWRIVLVEPAFPMDAVRSARALKICGHPALDSYERSLWTDNRIELQSDATALLDDWLADADWAMPHHSFRETVGDEFVAVLDAGYDEPARVHEQLYHYGRTHPNVLQQKPYWTAMIARRATAQVSRSSRLWLDQVLRYSRRDQLSVNLALARSGQAVRTLPFDAAHSRWHRWRGVHEVGRRAAADLEAQATLAQLPNDLAQRALLREVHTKHAQARDFQESNLHLVRELTEAQRSRKALAARIAELELERQELSDRLTEAQESANQAMGQTAQSQAETARLVADRQGILTSRSWRATAPLRAVAGLARSAQRGS